MIIDVETEQIVINLKSLIEIKFYCIKLLNPEFKTERRLDIRLRDHCSKNTFLKDIFNKHFPELNTKRKMDSEVETILMKDEDIIVDIKQIFYYVSAIIDCLSKLLR